MKTNNVRRAAIRLAPIACGLVLAFQGLAGSREASAAEPAGAASRQQQHGQSDDENNRLLELEERMKELEEALRSISSGEIDTSRMDELERRIEVLSRELEKLRIGEAAEVKAERSVHGLGPAASKVYRAEQGVSIGGYGEMLFQSFDSKLDDGSRSGKTDEADFLRAITYIGYKFNDRILFNSELEFEHASTGKQGEVSVEFAYLDFLLTPRINVRTGLLLVPMGFVNELHEPSVFLGARRPDVERTLIPTTWRENGVGIFGDLGPVSYRVYLVNGLDGAGINDNAGFSAGGIRGGRQKGSRAFAEDLALVGRADWEILPALTVGGSYYLGDSGQGAVAPTPMKRVEARTEIRELHAEWRRRGLEVRALYVDVDVDDAELINDVQGLTGDDSVGEEMEGHYLQVGYDLLNERETRHSLTPFVRYEAFDTQKSVPSGFMRDPASDVELVTYGLSYRPIPNVVVKVDMQDFDNESGTARDQWNLAVGFLF